MTQQFVPNRTGFGTVLASLFLLLPSCLPAQQQAKPLTKAEVEEIVKQYIAEHPEAIVDSVRQLQAREQAKAKQRAKDAVSVKQKELLSDAASPVSKPDAAGQVQIVEFFDYRCGYCKRVYPTLQKVLAANPDVRLIYKEFPILGPDSVVASKAALAVAKQGKYHKFHEALMSSSAPANAATIEQTAQSIGVDVAKMKADMESPEIAAIIKANQDLGQALGVEATPTFVIAGEMLPGALDEAGFKQLIDKARAQAGSAQK